METNVSFNGNDLQTASILTAEIAHEGIPTKDAQAYALAHANKSALPFINYPSKTITLRGKLVGTSITNLDGLIDTFNAYFNTKDGNLDIDYNSGTRRYICTLDSMELDRPGGLAFANFTLVFICTQPFGQATSATTANTESNQTGATDTFTHTYVGSAPYQLPVITITYDSVTAGGSYVSVTNNANGQGIMVIDHTFIAADVLEIDCKNRTVKINGTEVDFLGSFPELPPGSQQLNYADGFSARQFDITITYYPLYL
jgi:hypothetical protein